MTSIPHDDLNARDAQSHRLKWSMSLFWFWLFMVVECLLLNGQSVLGQVEGFYERFNGSGDYDSVGGLFSGLDNPGWRISGDGNITDEGYVFVNMLPDPLSEDVERDRFRRALIGQGGFRERIVLGNLDLGEIQIGNSPSSFGGSQLFHTLGEIENKERVFLNVIENIDAEPASWVLMAGVSDTTFETSIPRGEEIAIEVVFDYHTRLVTLSYDHDTRDDESGVIFGPFNYVGEFQREHETHFVIQVSGAGRTNGIVRHWSLTPISGVVGDFNGNEVLDAADIDLLSAEVRAGTNDMLYDLNDDRIVDNLDRQVWVHDLKGTYFGDADLNGVFDSADLVLVLGCGKYEDGIPMNSTWLTGDWNGDGDFTSGDLVLALADGGYGLDARSVPEPNGLYTAVISVAMLLIAHRYGFLA